MAGGVTRAMELGAGLAQRALIVMLAVWYVLVATRLGTVAKDLASAAGRERQGGQSS